MRSSKCTCTEDTPLKVYPGYDGFRHGMKCLVVNDREAEE